jgi:hypothetical protein
MVTEGNGSYFAAVAFIARRFFKRSRRTRHQQAEAEATTSGFGLSPVRLSNGQK